MLPVSLGPTGSLRRLNLARNGFGVFFRVAVRDALGCGAAFARAGGAHLRGARCTASRRVQTVLVCLRVLTVWAGMGGAGRSADWPRAVRTLGRHAVGRSPCGAGVQVRGVFLGMSSLFTVQICATTLFHTRQGLLFVRSCTFACTGARLVGVRLGDFGSDGSMRTRRSRQSTKVVCSRQTTKVDRRSTSTGVPG